MIELIKYSSEKEETIVRIIDFFEFHAGLVYMRSDVSEEAYRDAEETLEEWLSNGNELYVIYFGRVSAGFLRLRYRGPIVAWIEDIYVDSAFRGKGIATEAIRLAEDIVMSKPGYTAVCFDVAPRNTEAVKLYHKLGYTDVSLITLRKEFGKSKRDCPLSLFDREFYY